MIAEEPVTLPTSDGVTLEGRVALPPKAQAGVVICHPHPLYGGDMDNPVVVRIAEVCQEAGLATLRFNFRGVGRSTGRHDGGAGEQRDAEAALDHLAAALGAGHRLALAGYSFGAVVVAQVAARRADVAAVAVIGPPLAMTGLAPFAALAGSGPGQTLVVTGSRDEYCPREALEALGRALPGATVRIVEETNHFFFGKLFPLGRIVADWAGGISGRNLLPGQPERGGGAS